MAIIGRTTNGGQVTGHKDAKRGTYLIVQSPVFPYSNIATVVIDNKALEQWLFFLGYKKINDGYGGVDPI